MNKRFWEIDFLRGIAIIMMVIFHFLWDFKYYYNPGFSLSKGFWAFFQIITASLFLFLVGVSLAISNNKNNANFTKNLKRGMKILSFGLLITIITGYIFPNNFIIFGILHLIGTSIIISYPLAKFKYINLMLGVIFIIIGNILKNYSVDFNWLLFFGAHSNTFNSIDYFPIFPWMGVILIGLFFGNLLYANNRRNFIWEYSSASAIIKPICFFGRNSLIIYLLHQIVLFGLFSTINLL